MALSGNGQEAVVSEEEARHKNNGLASLSVSTSRKGLLSNENSPTESSERRLSYINKLKLIKQIAEKRDEVSRFVPSSKPQDLEEVFTYGMVKTFDYGSILQISKKWSKNPLNMVLLLWVICVAVSGAILFLVMTGMLNHVIRHKSERDEWFEVNNQILNALFTLMCLYQHPKRFHHLVLLLRWKPEDILRMREIYCKNGTYKPHEWAHMMIVVFLLHLNCFAQYALCGLNLGYKRSQRPPYAIGICISVAIVAPAVAGLYCILSPLGKDYESDELDCETPVMKKRYSFTPRNDEKMFEEMPKWKGNLFDLCEDIKVAYLSIFCTFCVFGWNMERLGFGNMYVHIATFILLCTAPFWIFNLAAANIENDTMREILVITGVLLCLFGLLYGGFWRTQMRKRFNLSHNDDGGFFCSRKPEIGDCLQWLFCCWCSLAQEVRTVDYYEIVEDEFIRKETCSPKLTPLPRESSTSAEFRVDPMKHFQQPNGKQEARGRMKPPSLLTIRREDNGEDCGDSMV